MTCATPRLQNHSPPRSPRGRTQGRGAPPLTTCTKLCHNREFFLVCSKANASGLELGAGPCSDQTQGLPCLSIRCSPHPTPPPPMVQRPLQPLFPPVFNHSLQLFLSPPFSLHFHVHFAPIPSATTQCRPLSHPPPLCLPHPPGCCPSTPLSTRFLPVPRAAGPAAPFPRSPRAALPHRSPLRRSLRCHSISCSNTPTKSCRDFLPVSQLDMHLGGKVRPSFGCNGTSCLLSSSFF